MLEAVVTGRRNSGQLPAFVYGVPVKGKLTPVWEDAVQVADNMDKIKEHSINIHALVQSATGIINKIRNNSAKSNIIALKASIEGARAGEIATVANISVMQCRSCERNSKLLPIHFMSVEGHCVCELLIHNPSNC